jgi:YD repeat-containing protein
MCNADRKIFNPELNAANNRMAAGQGWAYDAAGNVTTDAEGRTFIYDVENKQSKVRDQYNTVIGQYAYDGDGKRVKKHVPSTGETTIFMYDDSDRLVAEYSTAAETAAIAKTSYLTIDHLGSPRVVMGERGEVVSRQDFSAFGEEIVTPERTSG